MTTPAESRLKAAKLRVQAAHQDESASAYERQAAKPAYQGQDIICLDKARVCRALAAQSRAEADVLDNQTRNLGLK